jgi:peptide chain release factor subunit 1
MVLVTDDTDMHRVTGACRRCGGEQSRLVERPEVIPLKNQYSTEPCPDCRSMEVESAEQDLVDYLSLICSKTGTAVEVVSGRAEHGAKLANLGKVAAILRYNPAHS